MPPCPTESAPLVNITAKQQVNGAPQWHKACAHLYSGAEALVHTLMRLMMKLMSSATPSSSKSGQPCKSSSPAQSSAASRVQGRTGPPGYLAFARRAGWSAGQVGRHVKC